MFGHDTGADAHGSDLRRGYRAVDKARRALYTGVVADIDVADFSGVGHPGSAAYAAALRAGGFRVRLNHVADSADESRTVAVHGNHPCKLGREPLVHRHLAASGLVQDRDIRADSKSRVTGRHNRPYVLDEGVLADVAVRDVVGHPADIRAGAYRTVVQGCVADA